MSGLDKVRDTMAKLSGPQMREATVSALNDTSFEVRRAMQREIASVFDRPTPFITRAPKVAAASPETLSVTVIPTLDSRGIWSPGGKVGVDPQQVLRAQDAGGRRHDKRSEVALRRAGLLPSGFQTTIPKDPYPGSDDGRGNLRGAFLTQLLSYLQAQGAQGFKQNMKPKRIATLADRTKVTQLSNRRAVKVIRGVVYFVSHGRIKGNHLPAGVWAKTGTHGADVRPVLLFVKPGNYKPKLNMERIAKEAGTVTYFEMRMRFRIRQTFESLSKKTP